MLSFSLSRYCASQNLEVGYIQVSVRLLAGLDGSFVEFYKRYDLKNREGTNVEDGL